MSLTIQTGGLGVTDRTGGTKAIKVLCCDFDPGHGLAEDLRAILNAAERLKLERFETVPATSASADQFAAPVRRVNPDLAFVILPSPWSDRSQQIFEGLRRDFAPRPIIAVTPAVAAADLYELLQCGASDFVTPPLKAAELVPRVHRLLEQTWRGDALVQALKERLGLKQIIGESPALLSEIRKIPRMARCDATVLISGETGTGKEVCARAVHYLSPRAGQPFVAVNCGALPVELVEYEDEGRAREPWGFVKQAFTQF